MEGGINDRVYAIPLLIKPRNKRKHGTLRLYCIRISETLLIIGGGGLKVTDKYEDDANLLEHVSRLQAIDAQLSSMESDGLQLEESIMNITIEMDKKQYTDPAFKEALEHISPAIRKEVGFSFDITKRISDLLVAKHWTQADLARATGKKASLVSRWLSGTHNFTIQTIAEIESALGASIITVNQTRARRKGTTAHNL